MVNSSVPYDVLNVLADYCWHLTLGLQPLQISQIGNPNLENCLCRRQFTVRRLSKATVSSPFPLVPHEFKYPLYFWRDRSLLMLVRGVDSIQWGNWTRQGLILGHVVSWLSIATSRGFRACVTPQEPLRIRWKDPMLTVENKILTKNV
jgi:hypothetical protein